MKTRMWHITIVLIFAIVFIGALSASVSGRAAQAFSAPPPIGPQTPIGFLNSAPLGAACSPEAPVVVEANTLQVTFQSTKDAYVRQNSPTVNYSATTYLRAGRILAPSDEYQTLTQFDISSLPANATIVTATLEMYSPVSSTPNIRTYAALGSWAESTVTWNTKPTYSTDYGSQTVNGLGWHKWDVTALVQQWQSGTRANNGFLLAQAGTTFGTLDYDSRENTSLRMPRLTVIYATQGSPAILPVQADTWINQALPSNNYGSDGQLYVSRVTGNARNTLLKFDTSSLPSSLVVVSASLELYSDINLLNAPAGATDIWADAIIAPWDETTVNWSSRPVTQAMGDLPKAYSVGWLRWDVTNLVRGWYSGTIDNHGIQLRLDPSGATSYSFSALPANSAARLVIAYHTCVAPLTNVAISGATSGVTGTQYTFTARPQPTKPTAPITYTWRATGLICGGSHQPACPTGATFPYTFTTTGTKTISVTAINCGGTTFADTHQIVINAPPPGCPYPVSDVSVIGVSKGLTGTNYTFTATASPINSTTPITFTWEVSNQAPQTMSGVLTQTSKTFTWSGIGAKTITVTVQNCGGAVQTTQAVDIVPPSALPDLIVSSGWYEPDPGRAAFIVKNIGGSDAEPGPGYSIDIYQNDVLKSQGLINTLIPPGGLRAGYINYTWFCASGTATAKILADSENIVAEGNEANNTWSEVWPCDQMPPRVTSGPTVLATTEHTATIRWMTNESASYELRYGTNSGVYPSKVSSAALNTTHFANLSGLTTDRVYHYTIVITDAAGTVINTPDYLFETKPACSDTPNIIGVTMEQYPYSLYEFYTLKASVVDATCVDKLDFFLDNILIGTDYTPDAGTVHFATHFSPPAKGFPTRASFFKQHTLKVEGRSKAGTTANVSVNVTPPTPPVPGKIEIGAPEADRTWYFPGATVPAGKNLPVTVNAYEYEWKCTWSGFSDNLPPELEAVHCADVDKVPQTLTYNLTGGTTATQSPVSNTHTYQYPIGGKAMGDYTLTACVRKSTTDLDCASQGVRFEQGAPNFEMTRTVKRVGNYFEVNLLLHNLGTTEAYLDTLSDQLIGFQPGKFQGLSNNSRMSTFYNRASRTTTVDVDFFTTNSNSMRLIPNGLVSLSYMMVPILYEAPSDFAIGSAPLRLCYYEGSATGPRTCRDFPRMATTAINAATGVSEDLGPALNAAFSSSDYMIVTNPSRLFDFYTDADVAPVLESMAHLAYLKNGLLGYLSSYDKYVLDDLVEKNGLWKNLMHPDFFVKNKGYLLIVGETEIVDAWYEGTGSFTTWPGIPDKVHNTDLWYANTAGDTARPELVVGRIVGDNPQYLVNGLSGAIAVAEGDAEFDRSHALLASGRGDGVTSNFIPTVDIIEDVLTAAGVDVFKFHSLYVSDPAGEFSANTANRDVWFFRDHGCEDCWGDVLGTSGVLWRDMGNTRPVAFAAACLAGNYEATDDLNLPDAFMNKGVGAYIGSTEISNRPTNDFASKYFFRNWPLGQSAGVALNNARIAVWDDDGATYDNGKLWAFEYELYGDPKFGLVGGAKAPAVLSAPTVPATSLEVHVPNYEVEHVDGADRVSIPGGLLRLEPGRYEVPYWQVSLDYPKGTRVASITLTSLATPVITTGLHLITTTSQMDCEGCPVLPPPALLDTASWVPPLDPKYEWSADVNGDGSTTVRLKVYPFFYNAATTDIQFYPDFTFNIDTYAVPVSIVALDTDKTTYPINGSGTINLLLNNASASADFFVDAALVEPVSGDVVSGLLLKSVHALSGTASIDLPFSGLGIPAGDYAIRVRVLDGESRVMDSATTAVALGIRSGVVTTLNAPTFFKPGQSINASLTFNNAGDIALNGVATIEVYPTGSVTRTAIFTQTITNLQPAQSINFPAVWNTTGVSNGDYRLIGYAKYAENLTSNAKEVALSTSVKVYLPLILR